MIFKTPFESHLDKPLVVKGRPIRPLISLRKHKLLAILLLVLMISVAGVMFIVTPPIFYTEAVVQILPSYVGNLSQESDYIGHKQNSALSNQIYLLYNYDVIMETLKKLGLSEQAQEKITGYPDFAKIIWEVIKSMMEEVGISMDFFNTTDYINKDNKRVKQFQNAIIARQIPNTYLINVGTYSIDPDGLATIINTLIETYTNKINSDRYFGKDIRVKNLSDRKMELQTELRALDARKSLLMQEIDRLNSSLQVIGISPVGGQLSQSYSQILMNSTMAHGDAHRKRLEAELKLAAIESKIKNQENDEKRLDEIISMDKTFQRSIEVYTDKKELLSRRLMNLSKMHPERQVLEEEMLEVDKMIGDKTESMKEKMKADFKARRSSELDIQYQIAKSEFDQAKYFEDTLAAALEEHKDKMTQYTTLYSENVELAEKIARIRSQINDIENNLAKFDLEENAPGYVRIVSLARQPTEPDTKARNRIVLMCIAAGFFLSTFVPLLIDFFEQKIKTPDDIEAILNFSPMGCILEQEDSMTAAYSEEQVRRLSYSIERMHKKQGNRYFVVSSVKSGGGTTKLTINLAKQLNRIGIKTLAIEANAFKPDLCYAGSNGNPGFISVLEGESSIEDVIIESTNLLPPRIPIGDTHGNRHLSTALERYNRNKNFNKKKNDPGLRDDSLNSLKNLNYDVILIDTPPILLSADVDLLSLFVDSFVLVVESEKVSEKELKLAAKIIDQVSPSMVAVVLNRVRLSSNREYFAKLIKDFEASTKAAPNDSFAEIKLLEAGKPTADDLNPV
jgi:Mrp family chromosome partitioning ATPase/uncharacterized protein involved in exopolysaccharide biosynthesis